METIDGIEVLFHDDGAKSTGHALYPGFKQESKILTKGSVLREGALALPCDILWERDVPIKLRDGTTIYSDVYRSPHTRLSVPAIISSGGFGKNGGVNRKMMDMSPWRHGVPQCTVSSLEKFEALDPAYWVLHGYAMVHPDTRGSWMSEGDTYTNCTLDGKDAYDIVEWVAAQSWSNKRVTMSGNSWLAQTQWFVGAENPPHLTCLAPWEGWNDLYNDTARRGGIPNPEFQQGLMNNCFPGLGRTEDVASMTHKYPTWNAYWEDRKARLDKITVPLYVTASWTNALHTRGTFRGWSEAASKDKWLRVHNSNEWPDLYYPQNVEDLRKFFDHYMKDGVSNGWEYTPRVRLSILNPGPGNLDIVNRPEMEFPLARQQSKRLFLDAKGASLHWEVAPAQAQSIEFDAVTGTANFIYVFPERTELTGHFRLKLWVEARGNEDIDLFTKFAKLDKNGQLAESICIDVGYLSDDPMADREKHRAMHAEGDKHVDVYFAEGATGRLRVSHRELDQQRSTPHQPYYTHANIQKLSEGQIVPVDIELWPFGMIWEAGEAIKLTVAGHNLRPELTFRTPLVKTLNKGSIVVHAGGEYDSHLLVPYIP
ncbi:hypothetical protein Sste5346_002402 [Sporothrix stenoceras]|uniref:Xaa-Pro dipeptidyl-peptidase C-terminal domain-containing protein n=1 Tax=Sporothrix stenoceras TaxID=5173 RepID=A0ABR3ZKG3_9PEZI